MFRNLLLFVVAALALASGPAVAKVRVAASTNDLASIASRIGGDEIEVFAIARANSDPHRVEALPSYMVKVSRAQVYLKVGLGLDQWAGAIIDGSRNDKVLLVDCSKGVSVLERPTGKVDASMGDVHPSGNPHFWPSPDALGQSAVGLRDVLISNDSAHAAEYRKAFDALKAKLAEVKERNMAKLKPYAAQMKMNYLVLQGLDQDAMQDAYGPLFGIPVTELISRDGRMCKKHVGLSSKDAFENEIKSLL